VALVLGPPECLRLAALAAVPLHLGSGEAEDAGPPEGLLHLFELERFDDGGHQMGHGSLLWASSAGDEGGVSVKRARPPPVEAGRRRPALSSCHCRASWPGTSRS